MNTFNILWIQIIYMITITYSFHLKSKLLNTYKSSLSSSIDMMVASGFREDLRNIAIIAHVDHGKTTLVDSMIKQSGR
jgi:hypothetical protein